MTVMRANLNLSEATRRGVGLEALRAASNAAQIQKCLTRKGLWLRIGRSGVRLSQPGFQPSTAQAALESPARSHNHGESEFFSTLLAESARISTIADPFPSPLLSTRKSIQFGE